MCGLEFETNNTRAKYCIYCRDKAQAARNRAYADKKNGYLDAEVGMEKLPLHFVNGFVPDQIMGLRARA